MLFEKAMNLVFLISALTLGIWPALFTSYDTWARSDHGLWLFYFSCFCLPVPVVNTVVLLRRLPRSHDQRISLFLHIGFFLCVAILYFTDPVGAMSFHLQWLAFTILGAGAAITAVLAMSRA